MAGSLEMFFFQGCCWEGNPWDARQPLVELREEIVPFRSYSHFTRTQMYT